MLLGTWCWMAVFSLGTGCLFSMCLFSPSCVLNFLEHKAHFSFGTPSWLSSWTRKLELFANCLEQYLQVNDFIPLCLFKWSLKSSDSWYNFIQISHWKSLIFLFSSISSRFSGWCLTKWLLKMNNELNFSPQ